MGKVPMLGSEVEINGLISQIKGATEEARDELQIKNILKHINDISWRLLSDAELQARVNKLYAEVNLQTNP